MAQCSSCHKNLENGKIGFRDECIHCGADLHTCLNCLFYDPSAYLQCRETIQELVANKDKANFCDYFQFGGKSNMKTNSNEDAKNQLAALFKK